MMDATLAWVDIIDKIMIKGRETNPRGMKTKELLCSVTQIDMNNPIVLVEDRKVGYDFMFAEAWWILTGRDDVESIEKYAPSISKYSDDGKTFTGAYGPRVIKQLNYIVDSLAKDQDTRQAILTIWTPNPRPSKDIPCTVSLQFIIRDGKLHCIAGMRSSDAWIGYIYDIFNFSAISAYVMAELKAKYNIRLSLGELSLVAGSQHIYERNFKQVRELSKFLFPHFIYDVFDFEASMTKCKDGLDVIAYLAYMKDKKHLLKQVPYGDS